MESRQRWYLKKAARKAVVLGSLSSGSLAVRRLAGRPKVRAITYHRFGHTPRDPWCIDPGVFEQQMQWLAAERLAVSLDEVLRFARGEIELPEDSVLVTFDDGFQSVLTVAVPILRRYSIPAVSYVTTRAISNPDADKGAGAKYLSWEELAELSASGIEVGSHSHTHRSMAKLPPEEIRRECQESKALIEGCLNREVTSFAYPFGMRRDESPVTERILRECGYSSVFISQHGTIQRGANPLRLPRVKVEAGEPFWTFKLLCRGAMDAWSLAEKIL